MAEGIEKGKKRDNFTSGVLILSLSAVIVKIIGLVYKIPMLRLLGSEGMGYFNSAYEIYALFCSFATAGLPVAMSVMISSEKEGESGAARIFRGALKLFLILGTLGTALSLIFAKPFAEFLGSRNAAASIFAIAPCVLLICLSSAYRGYFQGKGRMLPTAVSQVIEALGKLILGLIFAFIALNSGADTPIVAAMAVVGLTLGTAASALYLVITKRLERTKKTICAGQDSHGVIPRLLKIAVPVTLSSSVISVTKVIDMSMILRRLQSVGYSSQDAFAAYGNYTTLALPLFSLAPALVTSVAMPLIPALGRAAAEKDEDEKLRICEEALRLTAFVSTPIGVGLALFARPVLSLIFSGQDAAVEATAPLLSILGLSVTMSCLITVGNAILQSFGRPVIPIISIVSGSLLKIILAFVLIGDPNFGLLGAPISTFFCNALINAINFYFIGREMKNAPRALGIMIRPFFAAAISVVLARVAYNTFTHWLGEGSLITLCSVALAAALYLATSILFGAIGKDEISNLFPKEKVLRNN